MARQYPWTLADVPWSPHREYTRGTHRGLPLVCRRTAPPSTVAATRRQLRAVAKRPGGQPVTAYLILHCRKACKVVFAALYLVAHALPVRPMTPARHAALRKAMAARCTCRRCGETGVAETCKPWRWCEPCLATDGVLEPWSYLHDFLTGIPTVGADEHHLLPLLADLLAADHATHQPADRLVWRDAA
jgi:hypothetical protein